MPQSGLEGTAGPNGYNTWFGGRSDLDLSKLTVNQVVAEQKRRLNSGEATYNGLTSAAVMQVSFFIQKKLSEEWD